jgi:hypothetical protein
MRGTGSFGRVGDPTAGDPRSTGSFGRVGSPIIRQRDSALPDPPPGSKGVIAAIETDNVAAFARDLRVLRAKVALDYPDCRRCRSSSPTSTPATATSPTGKSAGTGW